MDTEAAIQQLGQVLAQLEATPQNVPLLRQQLLLSKQLGMKEELLQTTARLAELVMLDETIWLEYFEQALDLPASLESALDILEKLDQAENDYLSEAILLRHLEILSTLSLQVDEVGEFLSEDTVRGMMRAVVDKSRPLMDRQDVWKRWLAWEVERKNTDQLHKTFLYRMSMPHLGVEETSSMYSTFCTETCPNEYENRMVTATEAAQRAKSKLSEKRYGKTRGDFEEELAFAQVFATKSQVLLAFMDWELDQRAKHPKSKGPAADAAMIRSVFERTIALYGEAQYKDAEALIWQRYIAWAETEEVRLRALRACPENGHLWAVHLNIMELSGSNLLKETFDRALALGTIIAPAQIAELYITRAASLNRAGEDESVLLTLAGGIEAMGSDVDSSWRLEKFTAEWAETRASHLLDQAVLLLEKPSKSRSSSYQMILLRTGLLSRKGDVDTARTVFKSAITRSDLDWPEAIYEAYLLFERVHGDLNAVLESVKQIEKEQAKLAKRREKQAIEAYQAAPEVEMALAPELQPEPQRELQPEQPEPVKRDREHTQILVTGVSVDTARLESFFAECGVIREVVQLEDAALVEFRSIDSVPAALAKDRKKVDASEISVTMLWRSTLWVTNLAKSTDDAAVWEQFKKYGKVLQTRWPSRKYGDSRRFCYVTMESPAAAQNALELHGSPNGEGFTLTVKISDPSAKAVRSDKCTAFVGGLPAKTTEEDIRELFEKASGSVGTLMQCGVKHVKLGWDAKRNVFKGFAFVEMGDEAGLKAALELNGTAFNGRIIRISVSDPQHASKKEAPEANPAEKRAKTVRLHGLPDDTQEGLLQQAVEKIVPVKRLELFAKQHEAIAELANEADVGKLLLRSEPFIFNGSTITFSTGRRQEIRPEESLAMAPRVRKGKALGKGRSAPVVDKALPNFVKATSQDDFRAVVESKNKQRAGTLEKRKAEAEPEHDVKKSRT